MRRRIFGVNKKGDVSCKLDITATPLIMFFFSSVSLIPIFGNYLDFAESIFFLLVFSIDYITKFSNIPHSTHFQHENRNFPSSTKYYFVSCSCFEVEQT